MISIQTIVTSAIFSALVSALISYLVSIRLKRLDFQNDYFKEILKKRLDAYDYIERQIAVLRGVVLDDDRKAYHLIFSYGEEDFHEFQKNVSIAISKSLWIDEETLFTLEDLNGLFFKINNRISDKNSEEIIEIGKEYYKDLSNKRKELEFNTKNGLYNLHDMKKAFNPKRKERKRYIEV